MRTQCAVIKKKAEAAQRSGESLRPGHAVLGPVLFMHRLWHAYFIIKHTILTKPACDL